MPGTQTDQFSLTSERAALANFLDAQREGLIRKIEGLDDAQARQTPTASSLSLLGLVKHAATWERRWFQVIMAGRELPERWPAVETDPEDADLLAGDEDTVDHWLAYYRERTSSGRRSTARERRRCSHRFFAASESDDGSSW